MELRLIVAYGLMAALAAFAAALVLWLRYNSHENIALRDRRRRREARDQRELDEG